jgi:flagellar hook-associated protein FlgK
MNDKEEYRARIEAQMASFNETIEEITAKAELRKATRPDFHTKAKALVKKHEDAKAKLKELEKSDENSWQKIQDELDTLVSDVNEDIRSALAYFG